MMKTEVANDYLRDIGISTVSILLATGLSYFYWVFLMGNWIVPALIAIGMLMLPKSHINGWDWAIALLLAFGLHNSMLAIRPESMITVLTPMVMQTANLFLVKAILWQLFSTTSNK